MASPPSSGTGRPRELRWMDESPASSASPRRSYRQALEDTAPPSAALVVADVPRRIPRSEVHRVPPVDAPAVAEDPWEVAQSRHSRRRQRSPCHRSPRRRSPRRGRPRPRRQDPPARSPPARVIVADGACSKCLYPGHPRSECRRDWRCRRCGFYGHVARACTLSRPRSPAAPPAKRPRQRSPRSSSSSVAGPRRPASPGAPSGAPASSSSPSIPVATPSPPAGHGRLLLPARVARGNPALRAPLTAPSQRGLLPPPLGGDARCGSRPPARSPGYRGGQPHANLSRGGLERHRGAPWLGRASLFRPSPPPRRPPRALSLGGRPRPRRRR